MSGPPSTPLLFVCTTCVRDAPPVANTQGQRLAAALRTAVDEAELTIREVACLNGCRSPCNVALRGGKRWTYRFSRCTLDDVDALLAAARVYWRDARGELQPAVLPAPLREKLSACTPPPA